MKWLRPSGVDIETNDLKATIEYCKSLGWKEAKPKRTRRTREQIKQDNKLLNSNKDL